MKARVSNLPLKQLHKTIIKSVISIESLHLQTTADLTGYCKPSCNLIIGLRYLLPSGEKSDTSSYIVLQLLICQSCSLSLPYEERNFITVYTSYIFLHIIIKLVIWEMYRQSLFVHRSEYSTGIIKPGRLLVLGMLFGTKKKKKKSPNHWPKTHSLHLITFIQ